MSRALGALAARIVGRRVTLRSAVRTGTVTRVTGRGMTVTITGVRAEDVAAWLE